MGLPHLDFRVPESSWFKAALERVQFGPMLSSSGSLSLPYKIAIVAVMALVACGTLVTFGTAGAETSGSASAAAALPGTNEASPQVQGQVLPPQTQSLLTSEDLLSTLNLTDYSPTDSTSDSSDNSDNSDSTNKKKNKKTSRAAAARPTTKATTPAAKATSTPTPKPTTSSPSPTATPKPSPSPSPSPKPSPSPSPKPTPKCVIKLLQTSC